MMHVLMKFLPLARNESVVEKQEHPANARGQWAIAYKVTAENRDFCEFLCRFGNFQIIEM
jgi:hypothetical protein